MFGAVGDWIAANRAEILTRQTYVLRDVENLNYWMFSLDRYPELDGAGQPMWGEALTEDSWTELEAALGAMVDLEPVDDRLSVEDPEGFEVLGCRQYLGDRTMLRLGQPLPVEDNFVVYVNLDEGCQGAALLLMVEPAGPHFEVTQVISDGSWIL